MTGQRDDREGLARVQPEGQEKIARGPHTYFGQSWGAPVNLDKERTGTPVGEPCALCGEAIVEGDRGTFMGGVAGWAPAHAECTLREVFGGIGHHEDHAHWCNEVGDPDGGRTYRQSALAVWELVTETGRLLK